MVLQSFIDDGHYSSSAQCSTYLTYFIKNKNNNYVSGLAGFICRLFRIDYKSGIGSGLFFFNNSILFLLFLLFY